MKSQQRNTKRKTRGLRLIAFGLMLFSITGCGGGGSIQRAITSYTTSNTVGETQTSGGSSGATTQNTIEFRPYNWIYPKASSNGMNHFHFQGNDLYAVGKMGTIIKTSDGGINFTVNTIDFNDEISYTVKPTEITGIDCLSGSRCLAVTSTGHLLRTMDGGTSWHQTYSDFRGELTKVECLSDGITCIAVGEAGTYLRTVDGGSTWTKDAIEDAKTLYDIECHESQGVCFTGEYWKVHKSTDKGKTWTKTYEESLRIFYDIECPESASFCYAVTAGPMLYRLSDKGANWIELDLPEDIYSDFKIQCSSDGVTCLLGIENGKILKTTDSGANWTTMQANLNTEIIGMGCKQDLSTCYVSGYIGVWKKTADQGETWTTVNEPDDDFSLQSIGCFGDGSTCYAVGGGYSPYIVFKTIDNGATWTETGPGGKGFLYDIVCPEDASTCYIMGGDVIYHDHLLYITEDGGGTWISRYDEANNVSGIGELMSAACSSNDNCFFCGYRGVYKATNAGENWSRIYDSESNALQDIVCNNINSHCVAVGENGTIVTTTNSGVSWTERTSGITDELNTVYCPDPISTCYAAGKNGAMLKTTDGGANWSKLDSGTSLPINSIACPLRVTDCYAVTDYTSVLHTTNGGQSWIQKQTGASRRIGDINCTQTKCYLVGDYGSIMEFIVQ